MSVAVKINKTPFVKVKLGDQIDNPINLKLKIKKALDGTLIIKDHDSVDITISQKQNKIVLFPKTEMNDSVYYTQDRFFDYMRNKGIISYESIQGGNVYFSMEAELLDSKDYDPIKLALIAISEFLIDEEADHKMAKKYMDEYEQYLLDPDEENTTGLEDVPDSDQKGSIRPGMLPYGIYYRYYE